MKAKGVEKVLVIGGAGFIGSHIVDLLVESGYEVTILDSLDKQVHGEKGLKPAYLNSSALFIRGSLLDRQILEKVLPDVDAVVHLAAAVGVAQSMYEIYRYINTNTSGTALLLDTLVNFPNKVKKVIVASSMSIYGEGKYCCEHCSETIYPPPRKQQWLNAKQWDPLCPHCGLPLLSRPTDEQSPPNPASIYAMSKYHQEEMALLAGKTYGIPTVALRFFNVYGTRQALSNPYTGVCAIFSNRILHGKPPYIFEDGRQLRDFVHVKDVCQSILLALEKSNADYLPINIGSGAAISILELAKALIHIYGSDVKPFISGEFRKGDIRHCYSDITRARKLLGFKPQIDLSAGLMELAQWGKDHGWGTLDLFEESLRELRERRLT